MKNYFPVFLDLSNRNALVVGGGKIALRRVQALLDCGAQVTVVAPELDPKLAGLARGKKIRLFRRPFIEEDLKNQWLVISAANDRKVNERIGKVCKENNLLVNVVDQPELCSYITPALFRRGEVVTAISTGGASPALAAFLKRKMSEVLGDEVRTLAGLLGKYRARFLKIPMQKRKTILKKILTEETLEQLRKGKKSSVVRKIEELVL